MKYYSLNNILKLKSDFNFIIGQRANGKSYAVKKYILNDYKKTGNKFVMIRRYATDVKKQFIERYFSDFLISEYVENATFITMRAGVIYAATREKNKVVLLKEIGYCLALNNQIKYKSMAFNDVKTIVFEEFNANDYLPMEVSEFFNLYSTINRAKNEVRCFFIGNAVTKFNPYVVAFNLIDAMRDMKHGDIKQYTVNNVTIAVEYCKIVKSIQEKTPEFLQKNINEGEYFYGRKFLTKGIYKRSKLIFEYYRKCGDIWLIDQALIYSDKIYFFIYPYTGKPRKRIVNEKTILYNTHKTLLDSNANFKKLNNLYRNDENLFFSDGDTAAIYELYNGGLT